MLLWVLMSVIIVISTAMLLFMDGSIAISESSPLALQKSIGWFLLVVDVIFNISIYGFLLSLGMDFAKKVEAKLLFLDGHYNFAKDIFKPAVVVGTLYAGAVLIVNAVTPSPFLSLFFYKGPDFLFN